jgi:hypothetical protein
MPKVSVALLRQLVYPRGYRLPHLERMIWPPPQDAKPKPPFTPYTSYPNYQGGTVTTPSRAPYITPVNPRGPVRAPEPGEGLAKTPFGNLDLNEYWLFYGRDSTVTEMAHCRWCSLAVIGADMRKKHRKENTCDLRIKTVFKKLRDLKRCVICDKATTHCKWGVPICGEGCKREFMFSNPTPILEVCNQLRRELCSSRTTS